VRKVIYAMMVSVDGFIEGPDQDLGWHVIDEQLHRHFNEQERLVDIHLYGRRMYEEMAAYWPTADENPGAHDVEIEYARIWKTMPKIVFSKTLDQVRWNSRLVREDIPTEIAALKAKPGKDMAIGGADIAATFLNFGLIDEIKLYINPVIVGSGKPMFPPLSKPISLHLIATHTFDNGVVLMHYSLGS
jgi:dihydrofolate reductase